MHIHTAQRDRTNFPPRAYIQLNSCGIQQNRGRAYSTGRPSGRVDYHIIYVVEGSMQTEYAGEMHTLSEGNFILYEPLCPQFYIFPEGECVTSYWLHFTGTAMEEILGELHLQGGVYRAEPDVLIRRCFETLYGIEGNTKSASAVQNGTLLTLLGFLSRRATQETGNVPEILVPAVRLMRREYGREITVGKCAAVCNLSESRFQHLFRESVGVSPHRYLLTLRLKNAQELLSYTDLSISQVAVQCGFGDPLYFSRIFRREYGLSPRRYREGNGGGGGEFRGRI